ncbi:MAG: thymidylate kinase [Verrucomicrobia bacterium]|nr:thymidylate kinase [Verrucomicrobiota bacterium]
MSARRFYGPGIPGVNPADLRGKLIVIEGPDGSGRSTQIDMLTDWLEARGHAIAQMGLRRSTLVSGELESAKAGNILSKTTMSLFYATDFADQLENRIIPALKAGFIVLADRYIYTLMARDIVRGADPAWVEDLYGIALVPDAVFSLRVRPENLVERVFQKSQQLDHWESGMDLGLDLDMFKSFIKYKRRLQRLFDGMRKRYDFHVVNGNRSARAIQKELRREIEKVVGTAEPVAS